MTNRTNRERRHHDTHFDRDNNPEHQAAARYAAGEVPATREAPHPEPPNDMGYRHCRHRSAAALVTAVIVIKPPRADYTAGAEGASIEGVETFANTSAHVETPVDYAQSPPAGGPHSATWLNCGVYTESVSNENTVHSLEHGAIWVTYNEAVGDGDLDVLKSVLPSTHVVLSPVNGRASPAFVTSRR